MITAKEILESLPADHKLQVSRGVLQNKEYIAEPFFHLDFQNKFPTPKCKSSGHGELVGVRLLTKQHKSMVWPNNRGGIILLTEMNPKGRKYAEETWGNLKIVREVFGSLGD